MSSGVILPCISLGLYGIIMSWESHSQAIIKGIFQDVLDAIQLGMLGFIAITQQYI